MQRKLAFQAENTAVNGTTYSENPGIPSVSPREIRDLREISQWDCRSWVWRGKREDCLGDAVQAFGPADFKPYRTAIHMGRLGLPSRTSACTPCGGFRQVGWGEGRGRDGHLSGSL